MYFSRLRMNAFNLFGGCIKLMEWSIPWTLVQFRMMILKTAIIFHALIFRLPAIVEQTMSFHQSVLVTFDYMFNLANPCQWIWQCYCFVSFHRHCLFTSRAKWLLGKLNWIFFTNIYFLLSYALMFFMCAQFNSFMD